MQASEKHIDAVPAPPTRELCKEVEMPGAFRRLLVAVTFLLTTGCWPALAQRTQVKPGWNMFSPQQDIEIGKRAATDAQTLLPPCNLPRADVYLTRLGKKLAAHLDTGGVNYPWEFHCVNDRSINAFALPGGYVFVNRGAIEFSDNESQLAAVLAHELSHVALRHGTNQATKASAAQIGVGLFGALFGGSTGGALLTQLGSFTAGGILLRYSRSAETQADISGTQVLYDSGYDPRALEQFFEKLEQQNKSKNPPEFLSDHPNPDHRVEQVDEEIQKLGGTPPTARRDSAEFEAIKREVMALPVIKKTSKTTAAATPAGNGPASPPPAPSTTFTTYQASYFSLQYPDNWKQFGSDRSGISIGPEGGVVNDGSGHGALAYGVSIGTVPTSSSDASKGSNANDPSALANITQRIIGDLQAANPNLQITRRPQPVKLNNEPALSTYLSNDSPGGGREIDWLITVQRPDAILYFICTAPQNDFDNYQKIFNAILDSVRFTH
jgi:Zn-dependent protease with chaperone function